MQTIIVADPTGSVFDSVVGAAQALSARQAFDLRVCRMDARYDGSTDSDVPLAIVVQEERGLERVGTSIDLLTLALGTSTRLVVVPSSAMTLVEGDWIPAYFGIDVMLWVMRGARAIVSVEDLGSPTILSSLLEYARRPRMLEAIVIGTGPIQRLDVLDNEMRDVWSDISDEKVCWRTAFALAYAAPLSPHLSDWQQIAAHLTSAVTWFKYNNEDVRKALGRLKAAWGCEGGAFKHRIAMVALKRGFSRGLPDPSRDVDDLLPRAFDIDVSGRRRRSGGGHDWTELVLAL